jgi:hypothetical protein
LLGFLHALYTWKDIADPRRLVPDDRAVIAAMAGTGVRLARGGTTMWRAWVGFNFSHSLGAVLFGAGCVAAGLLLAPGAIARAWLLVPVAVSSLYVVMAVKYWFRIPAIGTAIATVLFAVAFAAGVRDPF